MLLKEVSPEILLEWLWQLQLGNGSAESRDGSDVFLIDVLQFLDIASPCRLGISHIWATDGDETFPP
jgi:hypothetical protein